MSTLMLIFATWFVVGSALTYAWITAAMRADQRAADAEFDRELHNLLRRH